MHVFIDESERSGYLLAATHVRPENLDLTRKSMRTLRLPRERRVHFSAERDSRRRWILARICEMDIRVRIYAANSADEATRHCLLELAVADAKERRATRLILDSRDPAGNRRDRAVLARLCTQRSGMAYEHVYSWADPLLWISDAAAWSFGAGGDWRRRIDPVIDEVIQIERRRSAKPRQPPSGGAPGLTSRGYCP